MTALAWAGRDILLQDTDLVPLLGAGSVYGPWIFVDKPLARIEGSSKALLVLYEENTWTQANAHNNMRFPRLFVDVWSDATRNTDRSVKRYDADDKIEAILALVKRHFHTPNLSGVSGGTLIWGTPEQVAARSGVPILGSELMYGPSYSDVSDTDGARMARTWFGVATV